MFVDAAQLFMKHDKGTGKIKRTSDKEKVNLQIQTLAAATKHLNFFYICIFFRTAKLK